MLIGVARDAFIYLLPTLLSRGLGLILLPIYTRHLAPRDYGLLELLILVFTLLNLIVPLELSQAIARFSPDAKTEAQRSVYFSTAFWFTAGGFAIVAVGASIAPTMLARMLLQAVELERILPLASLAMLANALLYLVQSQLRWNLQPLAYFSVSVVFSLFLAGVSVVLIVFFHAGVMGYVWGQLAGSATALALGIVLVRERSPLRMLFRRAAFVEMLSFSAPLVVSSTAVYMSTFLDRWIVGGLIGVEGVGVYSVAIRIASVVAVVATGVQLALTPFVYHRYREPAMRQLLGTILQFYLLLLSGLALIVGGFSREIVSLLTGNGYSEAASVAGWLCLSALLASLTMFAPGLAIEKKTGLIALANTAGALLNAVLGITLTAWFGLRGAATATILSGAAVAYIQFRLGQRYFPVPFPWMRNAAGFAVLLMALALFSSGDLALEWRAALVVSSCLLLTVTFLGAAQRNALTAPVARYWRAVMGRRAGHR